MSDDKTIEPTTSKKNRVNFFFLVFCHISLEFHTTFFLFFFIFAYPRKVPFLVRFNLENWNFGHVVCFAVMEITTVRTEVHDYEEEEEEEPFVIDEYVLTFE